MSLYKLLLGALPVGQECWVLFLVLFFRGFLLGMLAPSSSNLPPAWRLLGGGVDGRQLWLGRSITLSLNSHFFVTFLRQEGAAPWSQF